MRKVSRLSPGMRGCRPLTKSSPAKSSPAKRSPFFDVIEVLHGIVAEAEAAECRAVLLHLLQLIQVPGNTFLTGGIRTLGTATTPSSLPVKLHSSHSQVRATILVLSFAGRAQTECSVLALTVPAVFFAVIENQSSNGAAMRVPRMAHQILSGATFSAPGPHGSWLCCHPPRHVRPLSTFSS